MITTDNLQTVKSLYTSFAMNHKIHNDSGQESSQVEMEMRKAIKTIQQKLYQKYWGFMF